MWYYIFMDTRENNLSNYKNALELALKTVKEGTGQLVDKDRVFKDIENCTKMAQFLFSDEKKLILMLQTS